MSLVVPLQPAPVLGGRERERGLDPDAEPDPEPDPEPA
jgi:hypothetical protein